MSQHVNVFRMQRRPFLLLRKILRQKGAHKPTGNGVPIHAGATVGGSRAKPTQQGNQGAREPEESSSRQQECPPGRHGGPGGCPARALVQVPQGGQAPHEAPQAAHQYSLAKNPQTRARKRQPAQSLSKQSPTAWVTGSRTQRAPEKLPVLPLSDTSAGVTQKSQVS